MIIGVIFLVLGILYLFEALLPDFIINYSIVWPCILICIGAYYTLKQKKVTFSNVLLMFIGLWFLLVNTDIITGKYDSLFWPSLLIIIGAFIMFNSARFTAKFREARSYTEGKDGILKFYGVFGGCSEKVKMQDFKGAEVYSVFGGSEIDLRDISIHNDSATINVYSVFGGSEIFLPGNINLVFSSTAVLGGNDNKYNNEHKKDQKTIYLNCISVFGGSDIK